MTTTVTINRSTVQFEYDDVPLRCVHCGESFMFSELECGGEDEDFSDRICPKCYTVDCCELEFEEL